MKIVDRKTFLSLPPETIFTKYEPCSFGELSIKGGSIGGIDFFYQQIADAIDCHDSGEMFDKLNAAEKRGVSVAFDFDCQGRDGLFDADQLFAVWEPADVAALIARLSKCAAGVGECFPMLDPNVPEMGSRYPDRGCYRVGCHIHGGPGGMKDEPK